MHVIERGNIVATPAGPYASDASAKARYLDDHSARRGKIVCARTSSPRRSRTSNSTMSDPDGDRRVERREHVGGRQRARTTVSDPLEALPRDRAHGAES